MATAAQSLNERQQQIVELYKQGKSSAEIAEAVGATTGSINTQVSRLRKRGVLPAGRRRGGRRTPSATTGVDRAKPAARGTSSPGKATRKPGGGASRKATRAPRSTASAVGASSNGEASGAVASMRASRSDLVAQRDRIRAEIRDREKAAKLVEQTIKQLDEAIAALS